MPLYVTNGDREIKTFALLDGGANRHVVSKDISRRLKMNGKTVNMRITTLEKTVEGDDSKPVSSPSQRRQWKGMGSTPRGRRSMARDTHVLY